MKNTTLCYIENERGEYLMLHRVKKQNDLNHDKWIGVGNPPSCSGQTGTSWQRPMSASTERTGLLPPS